MKYILYPLLLLFIILNPNNIDAQRVGSNSISKSSTATSSASDNDHGSKNISKTYNGGGQSTSNRSPSYCSYCFSSNNGVSNLSETQFLKDDIHSVNAKIKVNLAQNKILINNHKNYNVERIEIFDLLTGTKIKTYTKHEFVNNSDLNLSTLFLPSGMYILIIKTESSLISEKFYKH